MSLVDQKILSKNDQNSAFFGEAVHDEIIIWNNQIFEEGLFFLKYEICICRAMFVTIAGVSQTYHNLGGNLAINASTRASDPNIFLATDFTFLSFSDRAA